LDGVFADEVEDFLGEGVTDFAVGHFSTLENDRDFDAVAFFEEFADFAEFDIEVVVADFDAEADLFELRSMRFLLGAGGFFGLLVLEFAPVDDFDYWRVGVGANLHKILARGGSKLLGLATGHHTKLFAVCA